MAKYCKVLVSKCDVGLRHEYPALMGRAQSRY